MGKNKYIEAQMLKNCVAETKEKADFLKFGFVANGRATDDQSIVRGSPIEKLSLFPNSRAGKFL